MDFDIRPATEAGRKYVELCEAHAADFATRAAEHDRDGTFPFENIEALRESGVLSAAIPTQFGGLGIESTQDLVAGLNRLARGDGSTAIAANMHMSVLWVVNRAWRDAHARGDGTLIERTESVLGLLGQIVVCVAGTEAGTSVNHPLTEATRADGGWRLNGRKIFATLSPRADILIVLCRYDLEGEVRTAFAFVPRDSDGLTIHDDWDAMGMRASGSNSLELRDVFVPEDGFNARTGAWGEFDVPALMVQVSANLALTAAMVGIAERARELVIEAVTTRRKAPSNRLLAERTGIQYQVAEMEIDLATARAMVERSAATVDAYLLGRPDSEAEIGALHDLMRDFQCTKWVANRKAIEVVDRALTLSGGAGYFTSNPLSRLYRDVRAGPFMQAYSPNESREYIGRTALGLDADLDL